MPVQVRATVNRLVFHNSDTYYTIASVRENGKGHPFSVVGEIPDIKESETYDFYGEWAQHPKYGRQFKISGCSHVLPTTEIGIERYLGSGLIKGIGPAMARRIVAKFGDKTLDVIEREPDRLFEIKKLGQKKIDSIVSAWSGQKEIREVMVFLQGNGISAGYAMKIYKQFGQGCIATIQENPYRMADEIEGIGFKIADKIAQSIGISKDSDLRIRSGCLYLLKEKAIGGHVCYPLDKFVDHVAEELDVSKEIIYSAIAYLTVAEKTVVESLSGADYVYLKMYYLAERTISGRIRSIMAATAEIKISCDDSLLSKISESLKIQLAPKQVEAVRAAIEHHAAIITGGPGTGKTTIIKSIITAYLDETKDILLGAPTGRAAKRMSEATGLEATTIHRMLKYEPELGGFYFNEKNKLSADLVIIDECSMIDCLLMSSLLKALPDTASVVFVGDWNQLPSVGAGSVFRDMIQSGRIPSVTLETIFRQAQGSKIVTNAHLINSGNMPELFDWPDGGEVDCYFSRNGDASALAHDICEAACSTLPMLYDYHPMLDIQVLTPMHNGPLGTKALNTMMQNILNPRGQELRRGYHVFRVGDKVMQTKNNYDKNVFNGDVGFIKSVNPEDVEMVVEIDGRDIEYDSDDLNEIMIAYAITIHKSQGSEYKAIVMPIHQSNHIMLQRNLLYTGLTRGKEVAVILGTEAAVAICVNNNKPAGRYTGLKEALKE